MWKEKNIRTVIKLDNALENFQVLFAYNSNYKITQIIRSHKNCCKEIESTTLRNKCKIINFLSMSELQKFVGSQF